MIAKELTDKVTEYRILNEHLMSKAMAILESADNLMIGQEYEKAHSDPIKNISFRDNFDSTLEYSKYTNPVKTFDHNKDFIDEILKNSKDLEENINLNVKSISSIRDKFSFAGNYSGRALNMTDDCNTSLSENEEEKLYDNKDIITMQNSFDQKDSESIVEKLLKTKLSIQQNGLKIPKLPKSNPETSDNKINNDCIKFLKTKIESQQEELKIFNDKLKKKNSECEELSKNNQSLQELKIRLMTQINNLKTQLTKKDHKIAELNTKIQTAEGECRTWKNEHDSLSKAAKDAAQDLSAMEVRLSRSLKELASLKEALNNAKQREKELKDSSRKHVDELVLGIKTAEKREKTILMAIKKQTLLIDNLKKQIMYLNTKVNVEESEKQLDKILKWEHK